MQTSVSGIVSPHFSRLRSTPRQPSSQTKISLSSTQSSGQTGKKTTLLAAIPTAIRPSHANQEPNFSTPSCTGITDPDTHPQTGKKDPFYSNYFEFSCMKIDQVKLSGTETNTLVWTPPLSNYVISDDRFAFFRVDGQGHLWQGEYYRISNEYGGFSPVQILWDNHDNMYSGFTLSKKSENDALTKNRLLITKWKNMALEWAKTTEYPSELNTMLINKEGNIVIGGNVCLPTEGVCRPHITQFSPAGDPIWSRLIGGDFSGGTVKTLSEVPSSGVLLAHIQSPAGHSGFLALSDTTDTLHWAQKTSKNVLLAHPFVVSTHGQVFMDLSSTSQKVSLAKWDIQLGKIESIQSFSTTYSPAACLLQNTGNVTCQSEHDHNFQRVDIFDPVRNQISSILVGIPSLASGQFNYAPTNGFKGLNYPSVYDFGNGSYLAPSIKTPLYKSHLILTKVTPSQNVSDWACWIQQQTPSTKLSDLDLSDFPLEPSSINLVTTLLRYINMSSDTLKVDLFPIGIGHESCPVHHKTEKSDSHHHPNLIFLALLGNILLICMCVGACLNRSSSSSTGPSYSRAPSRNNTSNQETRDVDARRTQRDFHQEQEAKEKKRKEDAQQEWENWQNQIKIADENYRQKNEPYSRG